MIWNLMEIVGENTTSGRIEIVRDLEPTHETCIGPRMGGVRLRLPPIDICSKASEC